MAVPSCQGLEPLNSAGGHNVCIRSPGLPFLVTPLHEVVQLLVVFRVDHAEDESRHLSEEQGFNVVI